ncbi:MAG: glutamine-hydrolyzing GMP synthase [Treponema sp.]|jgi:GMP synthase (glutamine-hydrolysing)|nr:glutamine-hydrolyzing GMP synthase [Treponema sp.]
MSELVLVLDFGGQYKELIARSVRGLSVYSEIRQGNISADEVKHLAPIGIILTGGPNSVYLSDSPRCDPGLFSLGIPILGICYGMHLMCYTLGGEVRHGERGEYGTVSAGFNKDSILFNGLAEKSAVLMSHGDHVNRLPDGFVNSGFTADCINAACENVNAKLYGVQFHPETGHTVNGREILRNFLYRVCGASGDYKLADYIDKQVKGIRQKLGNEKVLLALSGGVDSSVCAALLSKAVPGQLTCIFVDHGFMRQNEGDEIEAVFSKSHLRFIRVNAKEKFLAKMKGVSEPESKRKIIGEEFIRTFEEESAKLGDISFLAQGTIYPDVVESGGKHGATIKSHHNVGGLPKNLKFAGVIEPLSGLFKDEVRVLGKKLGLPQSLVNRQPFPGPGLAIRIMGDVTEEKLEILRKADAILREELDVVKRRPDQYFAVLTDTRTVGVKGDDRTYDPVIAIRAVITGDFMTCDYAPLPHKVLGRISSRITSEIPSVSRVVYDITSKPPATVEWE